MCKLDLTFVENVFLDLSQYTRNYAFMMVPIGATHRGNRAVLR